MSNKNTYDMTPNLAKKLLNDKNVYLTKEGKQRIQEITQTKHFFKS